MLALSILMAYALDLVLGDPIYALHPVRLVGKMVEFYEVKLREMFRNDLRAGLVLAFGLPADVFIIVMFLLWVFGQVDPLLQFAFSTFVIYSALSVKDLADHAYRVRQELENGNLGAAREALSAFVGRDTARLSSEEVARAAVETVAEGTLDGIISPFFYAALGGAPLAMAFKSASTLDSMVGYRNQQYEVFGRYSAKLDDVLNFIPARISPLIVALGSVLAGGNTWKAFQNGFREGTRNPSPNSGFPEASFAGALNLRLGGLNHYQGQPVAKPLLNEKGRDPEASDIGLAVRLMYFSSFFACMGAMGIWYLFFLTLGRGWHD